MTERQKLLASYLLNQTEYASQKQILTDLPVYTNAREIRSDVRDLNNGGFSYIIISNAKGYAIASQEEARVYLETKKKTALRMLELYSKIERKLQNNGQAKFNNANNIVELKTVCEK